MVTETAVSFDLIKAKMKESAEVEVPEKVDVVIEKIVDEKKKEDYVITQKAGRLVDGIANVDEPEIDSSLESDSEGVDCEEWEFNDTCYGVDEDGNVYDVDSGDKVGIRTETNGEYTLVMVSS